MTVMKKFEWWLYWAEKIFVGTGILVLTTFVFTGVITRYVFGFSFPWIEELSQYLMIWVAFIGAALCIRNHEHVGVDLIFQFLTKKNQRILSGVLALLSAAFMVYFSFAAYRLVHTLVLSGQVSVSMRWLPIYTVYLAAPVGGALMVFEFVLLGYKLLVLKQDN